MVATQLGNVVDFQQSGPADFLPCSGLAKVTFNENTIHRAPEAEYRHGSEFAPQLRKFPEYRLWVCPMPG